jgi:hypothetical protein
VRGARGALEPLFRLKVADFRMAWTFIDMVPADSLTTAEESAVRVNDLRLAAFHDPTHLLGRAMARRLGWKAHVAWDTYFVYKPGTLWTDTEMPAPDEWFHQLKDREVWEQTAEAELGTADWTHALAEKSEADPNRFRTGRDLLDALTTALNRTSGVRPAPTAVSDG